MNQPIEVPKLIVEGAQRFTRAREARAKSYGSPSYQSAVLEEQDAAWNVAADVAAWIERESADAAQKGG